MPRNDQVSRQWYLLRQLESPRNATLRELVNALPEDFPKNPRTIRRDLESLEAAGFPLTTDHANGQTRWKLMDGFRNIPALGFSPTELMSLLSSRNLLKPLEATEVQVSLNSALNKAAAALPPQGYEYVQDALMVMRGRRIEVELLFSKSAATWVKDKVWHPSQETALLKDGRLKMMLKIADTTELVGWILSFGSQVWVVRPDALRQRVREEARKILRS